MSTGKRIFGAFSVAVALFFFSPVVLGGWAKIQALKAARDERAELVRQRQEILTNVQAAFEEYQQKSGQADGQKFAALVPVRKDTAEVISALQAMATESGVQLGEVRTTDTPAQEGERFRTLTLNIELTGAYPGLRRFLQSMEQYVRLLNVNTIEAIVDAQNPSQLQFLIRADAYFIK